MSYQQLDVDNDIEEDEDVAQAHISAIDDEYDPSAVVRLIGLRKQYGGSSFPWCSTDPVFAVRGVSFSAKRGEIFCLLGHNGAGKSTTLGVLTGTHSQSSGEASILGLDIRQNLEQVRSRMGVCPQHDILWNELTVRVFFTHSSPTFFFYIYYLFLSFFPLVIHCHIQTIVLY